MSKFVDSFQESEYIKASRKASQRTNYDDRNRGDHVKMLRCTIGKQRRQASDESMHKMSLSEYMYSC